MENSVVDDVDKFNVVVSQEEARLGQLHPTPEEVPSCMSAFDNFLSCNSTPPLYPAYSPCLLPELKCEKNKLKQF